MDVNVFVVDEVADFGLAVILEVLGTANALRETIEHPPQEWTVTMIGTRRRVRTGFGQVVSTIPLADRPQCPDLLVIPAVNMKHAPDLIASVSAPRHRPVLELIDECRGRDIPVAAACTGTFFLAEAGALDGLTATTSWWLSPVFRGRYPQVDLDEGLTICHAAGVTTAGAAFAHVDLALSVVRSQSPALADLVTRHLLIGDRREQANFVIPSLLAQHDPALAAFDRWVRANLAEPIQIADAAAALGMSTRTLQRITAATLGMSPIEFVNAVRLDHATDLLRTTSLSADVVAARVGYLNAGTLGALIRRKRGVTMRELRHGAPWAGPAAADDT